MGNIDIVTKHYLEDSRIFADAFNYFIYDGKPVIQPEQLRPLDAVATATPDGETPVQKTRDLLKCLVAMEDDNRAYAILGLENQSDVHYAMPVRNLLYDALTYQKQVRDIADKHRAERDSATGAEFLSGFHKEDKLTPVITLVIYFGANYWDGPTSLHEMMKLEETDEALKSMIDDYKIKLITPAQIKAEDFENRTITNAEQALQGKTAGVQIISASAAPGSNPAIRIRGYSSNASSDPLYVVDGLRTKDISNLDPNDIESMEVLKDAASAAIYGAQAGNGVVLITTRKAKKGVRRISYDFQLSSQSLGRTPDILNAQEYVNYMTEGNLIPRETIDRYWDGKTNTDWIEETFESSMMQRHNVNFQGANDNGSLFASLSYLSNNGPIVGNKDVFDRITGTVNADYKVKDWLKFTTNNSFSRYHVQSVSEGSATGSLMLSAIQLDPLTPVTYTPDKLPDTMINYMNQGHT